MNTDIDRERGMLSAADREYLLGEREFGHEQSRRNAEARIRRRVRAAILDFDLLLHTLSEKDRRQVFERATTDEAFLDGLRATVAFVYLGAEAYGIGFEDVLEPAVRGSEEYFAAADRDETVSVDVTFEVETAIESSLEGVAARLDAGEPVTPRELFSVLMQGDYDVSACDRITIVGADEHDADGGILDRLTTYLDGELRRINDSRAVICLADASPAE
ncbi:hypothetical protein [Halosolutus gelatinilyticus]|uniref:hypothetical protein n=1 Tax=Halosolutus gelatinilyticus TaxID=2931975 RepID=UPI001FF1A15E|nr:hypothetical protein [Halosolutus gelatinilyticus]